jgi:hypothetical protein
MERWMSDNFYKDAELMHLFCKLSKEEFLEKNPHITELKYNKTRAKWHNKEDMRTTNKQSRQDEPTIEDMRWDIAEHEAMNMQTKDLIDHLYYGMHGLEEMPDINVRDEWNMLFGEAE